ncbi:hypothetical protein TRICHSKD4_3996 [Roseibium sp. TrichSKD4]|uniref:hypothetical protein n=1 Tax=Roseibium sp. TrichSKD4 TaxID=744980 RepID=UPI0001E56F7F|nr:hypothetical protein [Roseibium sp. TrichSKD4]EFO30407.1 hypothetical protein TRICHSKD4_3996 [Roseibium sp. TrichSKD4]
MILRRTVHALAASSLILLSSVSLSTASDKTEIKDYFAAADLSQFKAQVVTTNPSRDEVIVKAPNQNEFAIPVTDGFDLDGVHKNQFLTVSYLAGAVVDIRESKKDKPGIDAVGFVAAADPEDLPAGLSARKLTVTAKILGVDTKNGSVRFVGPAGTERTYKVSNLELLKDLDVKKGDLFDVTLFDAVGLEITNR